MNNKKKQLEEIYGFEFPDTFFEFWDFVNQVGENLFSDTLGIWFIGPFNVLKPDYDPNINPIWESRYYNDPPEFFTIMRGWCDGWHWGYYLDAPNNSQFLVASYYHNDAYQMSVNGYNIFEAVRECLEYYHRDCVWDLKQYPDQVENTEKQMKTLSIMREGIKKYYTSERPELGEEYLDKYDLWRERNKIIAATTRNNIGIVLPDGLYKPFIGEDKFQIWNYEPTAKEVKRYANKAKKALKEGYPGTALKLGHDLWVYWEYFDTTYELLDMAYESLGRNLLRKMLKQAKEFRNYCDSPR